MPRNDKQWQPDTSSIILVHKLSLQSATLGLGLGFGLKAKFLAFGCKVKVKASTRPSLARVPGLGPALAVTLALYCTVWPC